MVEPPPGPPLHVIATYPVDGQGIECAPDSPPDCGVPINTTIELRVDRFLDPATPVRQAIAVYTGSESNRVFDLEPEYDVIERVVVFRLREPVRLQPRTLYRVEIVQPIAQGGDGLRAFDGALLEPGPVPLEFSFMTGETEIAAPTPAAPPSCEDIVYDRFQKAGCAGADCHGGVDPSRRRMGLDLSSERGLFLTAIDQVAHQTDLGPTAGIVLADPTRVGVNMARIARGSPERSYLFYKLLRNPKNLAGPEGEPCEPDRRPAHNVALPDGACFAPSAEEAERLREWFVRGEPMPLAQYDDPTRPPPAGFTRAGLRDLARWIRAGADCL